MKLLLFSDLHVDSFIPPSTTASGDAAKREIRLAFERICALASDLGVDAVCCGGNLYDQATATSATGDLLKNGFASLRDVPVFLAPGSSDWFHPTSLYARVAWSHNVHIFTEPWLSRRELTGEVTLWGAAHTSPVHEIGFLDRFEVFEPGVHLALFHGCERTDYDNDLADGLIDGEITAPFDNGQIVESGLTHALLGHLRVRRDAPRYTYPGTAAFEPAAGSPHGVVVATVGTDGAIQREWHTVMPGVRPPEPAATSTDTETAGPSPRPLPAWVGQILDSEAPVDTSVFDASVFDTSAFDKRTVQGRFIQDVQHLLTGDTQRRVLRAGLLAMTGRFDDEED